MKKLFDWVKHNWFQILVILFLSGILAQLQDINENTLEVSDGIQVEIVESVDGFGITIPSVTIPGF